MTRAGDVPGLSACIVAKNEEDRLGACLDSLAFCDERLVVDSHSTDRTREVASEHGARVIERDWPGFGPQKHYAVSAATHDWVLCVDADERVSDELREEIVAARAGGFQAAAGYRMPRCSRWQGRWIRHGTWYPDHQMRLFDRRRGNWNEAPVHEKVDLEGPVLTLRADLLHEPYRSVSDHLATIDRYTTLWAEDAHARGRRAGALNLVINPTGYFLRSYVIRRGFLEGWRGLCMAYLGAHYVRLKYVKLLALTRSEAR